LDFLAEAREQGVVPLVLFISDPHRMSAQAEAMLQRWFDSLSVVTVYNEAVVRPPRDYAPRVSRIVPLRIPRLTPALSAIIDQPGFSFAEYVQKPRHEPTGLESWIKRVFLEFRELELRMLLEELRPAFQMPAG
jgi:hypothetical protein